ncbi:MAG: Gfo/Idh/MocA family oxidoreductase [Chloroflexi bacterium]|nr:Gfo/Idh/MocA family oxidoreductase [Chloroflexota bacterium]
MKAVVVGCGSIGQRHIRNLRALGVEEIAACDPVAERLDQVAREHRVVPFASMEAALANRPEAVLVCTPPHVHTAIAHQAIDAGAHVFIEKPIAHALDGLDKLLDAARKHHRLIYVGYNLRFHAGLLKLKELLDGGAIGRLLSIQAEAGQYLPDWRPTQDYRAGYNVSAAMGGGIILDASHELDYVRWLGGEVESVYCAAGHLSDLEMDVEDTAAITLRLSKNILAEVHVDCVQRGYSRTCKLIGAEGTLLWDFKAGVRVGQDSFLPFAPDPNEMYLAEMRHFLACVRGEDEARVDGETGKRVLEIALAAKKSAATRTEIRV